MLRHARTPKPPWRERKQRYLAHLEHASDEALRVSLADKLHNVRSINRDLAIHGEQVWKRFNASRQETICNYVSFAKVFARRRPGPMANELTHQVEKLKQQLNATGRLQTTHVVESQQGPQPHTLATPKREGTNNYRCRSIAKSCAPPRQP